MSVSSSSFLKILILLSISLSPASQSLNTSSAATSRRPPRRLTVDYYAKSCPHLEQLVASVTSQLFKVSPVTAPATLRLFFHDCFVEGCDASILISSRPGSKEFAEKDAPDNKDLANDAFNGISKAKALVESKCPGTVSCADILAVATRDYVHLAGGPYYQVKKGRWDGKTSQAARVPHNLPRANSTINELITLFVSKGLTLEDLVVLSGAHTIGYSHCEHLMNRIYDYKGPNPEIDPKLLKALRMQCPHYGGNLNILVPFDVATPFKFDNAYYGNLKAKMGLLVTDQALFLGPKTRPIVEDLAKDKKLFFKKFGEAMEKMGSIKVKRGRKHGERRKDCRFHA